jgi:hypothetical protein
MIQISVDQLGPEPPPKSPTPPAHPLPSAVILESESMDKLVNTVDETLE